MIIRLILYGSCRIDANRHGARYKIHFYCLAVEAGFYSDVVECLPLDPATWVRFPAGAGKIFSLYDRSFVFFMFFGLRVCIYVPCGR